MQLHTGVDFFLAMPLDELNDIAETVVKVTEEVSKRGQKQSV